MPILFDKPKIETLQVESSTISVGETLSPTNASPDFTLLVIVIFILLLAWLIKPFWGIIMFAARIGLFFFIFTIGLYVILIL